MRKKIPLIGGIINLIESLKGDIGIIENTDVATHSISSGSYVIWHNELYKASSAIAVDDALSSSNLTAVSGGAANELNNKIMQEIGVTPASGVTLRSEPLKKINKTVIGYIDLTKATAWSPGAWVNNVAQLEKDFPKENRTFAAGTGSASAGIISITSTGAVNVYVGSGNYTSILASIMYDLDA